MDRLFVDLTPHVLGIGVEQLGIEKLDAIGVSNSRFLAENIKAGEICHLWLPIRVMASSRKARMGGKEVRTSLSNRQTGTCSCIAWLYCARSGRQFVNSLRPIFPSSDERSVGEEWVR